MTDCRHSDDWLGAVVVFEGLINLQVDQQEHPRSLAEMQDIREMCLRCFEFAEQMEILGAGVPDVPLSLPEKNDTCSEKKDAEKGGGEGDVRAHASLRGDKLRRNK